ncbi:ScbA/BarX family gamma-butyrolactone biosynthesis protein [Streptomyces sp. NPDC059072]|uniref:ScbA/BarX family gamma-butyrolactone biosynthesis protein n=1 Tax=unclassified Streptomyces TaxID=2593676 RepID=UPI0036C7E55F
MSTSTFRVERSTMNHTRAGSSAAPMPRPYDFPSLTVTVPKELVHRASVAEVLLTDWQRMDEDRFLVTAQWPRAHSFFTPVAGGYHDPLITCETVRQFSILLGHAEFGIPLGHHFLMREGGVSVRPEFLHVGWSPATLHIEITCTEVERRGKNVSKLGFESVFWRDGDVVATGWGSFSCLAPGVYRRLRGDHTLDGDWNPLPLISPAAPQGVGRMSPMDVVLSPTAQPDRWQLRVDTRHPVLFDHPVDHVPGMVFMEAARQATAAVLGRSSYLPLSISSRFRRYGELDAPCMVQARRVAGGPDDGGAVLVTAHQDGALIFDSVVTAGSHGS